MSKSMTVRSLLFFRVAKKFGHEIISWDEEALVHLPPETYFSRRLDPRAITYVSHLFAWGKDNAALWRQYPQMPNGIPVHITGNPRSDMLRPEIRPFYQKEVEEIRKTYGKFILVNTNFNHVNAFGPDMNLFKPVSIAGQKPKFGRAARGMSREYAEGFRDHKQAIFEDFQKMIPQLDRAFPDYSIVVRPHPTENQEVYRQIEAHCERVRVTNEGNVVPWLMAARALIHNGCTTGVEAYTMQVPAVSYRATVNDYYDYGFYRLPNKLSHQCFNFEELRETIQNIVDGRCGAADGDDRRALVNQYLAAQDGPLACERMVDVLDDIAQKSSDDAPESAGTQIEQWLVEKGLHLAKSVKSKLPGSHNRPEFQRHRYPGIAPGELHERLARFQQLMGYTQSLKIEQVSNVIFQINP